MFSTEVLWLHVQLLHGYVHPHAPHMYTLMACNMRREGKEKEGKGSSGSTNDSHLLSELGKLLNAPHRFLPSLREGYRAEQQLWHHRLPCSAPQ